MSDILQVLSAFIDKKIKNSVVAYPAKVIKSTASSQKVDVQLMVYEEEAEAIIIPNVEALQLKMSANIHLYQPIEVGTQGIIIALDRQSSVFYEAGTDAAQKVNTDRSHDLSDCVFIPGFWQTSKACTPTTEGTTELKNSSMKITLHPSGKIEIKGASKELITVLSDTLGHLITLVTHLSTFATAAGASTIDTIIAGAASTLQTALVGDGLNISADKTNLDTLKKV